MDVQTERTQTSVTSNELSVRFGFIDFLKTSDRFKIGSVQFEITKGKVYQVKPGNFSYDR